MLARFFLLTFATIVALTHANAAAPCEVPIGSIVSIQGQVEIRQAHEQVWTPAHLNQPLCSGHSIRVGHRSRAQAQLLGQPTVRIDQNSQLQLHGSPKEKTSVFSLLKGAAYFFSRKPRRLTVETPFINAAIEGTEFVVRTTANTSQISVFEGRVVAHNERGRVTVLAGEAATARAGEPPQSFVMVRPIEEAQWAFYYPPILLAGADGSGDSSGAPSPSLLKARTAAQRGDFSQAFAFLEQIDETARTDLFYVYRAAILLNVGRLDEAQSDINEALRKNPGRGEAYALRAVIAVAQNDNARALVDGQKAVELNPRLAAAKIALSYAQQAQIDLKGARETLQQAVTDEPGNALAWARLAELWLMLGQCRRAVKKAEKARHLAPRLERTQTVLGFTHLAQIEIRAAKEAFLKAIELNSADPLPRFGLGLARIRNGDLRGGRADIENAVALDPNNALLRSYLGKAYFEERITSPSKYFAQMIAQLTGEEQPSLAGQQFKIAKTLDPNDPTPWFYDAILKQSENRPIEALQDLEKSIALNDNRAVYRSRQLLDKDRAARGASLARIYNDLGFEQLGINEASGSIAQDPSNAAAHRFLSDVYATQQRREIARVSELLQAQLLQDININPVQPSLSETGLNSFTRGGPTSVGFNEYTPLFDRNQTQLNATGVVGSNYTRSGEVVASGVYDRFSLSAGQYFYKTDGYRRNFNLEHKVLDVFAQAAITPQFNVQGEYIRRRSENGDRTLNFDKNSFFPGLTESPDQDMARLGARISPLTNLDILTSFIYTKRDENDFFKDIDLEIQAKFDTIQFENQYLYSIGKFNFIAGFGISDTDVSSKVKISGFKSSPNSSITHQNGYLYSNINLPEDVTWTVGLSFDRYEQEDFIAVSGNRRSLDKENLNPKLGVQWNITERLKLRAAAFRWFKPALTSNRTIEPTEIAGFNQLADDFNGTDAWRFGAGLDARLHKTVYVGAEYLQSEIDSPFFRFPGRANQRDRKERTARAYLHWTPTNQWVLSGNMVFESFDDDEPSFGSPSQVDSFSVPLSFRYFSSTGIFAGASVSFVRQDVNRKDGDNEGSERFAIVDGTLGFRLPERRGVISIEARNLLNSSFRYQDDNYRTAADQPVLSPYLPERAIFCRLTLQL
ncbi:MAG: FecR domain-containing protein [Hyphomicrobiales bacterium]|nr:FecR domain-containing protein [Hyphomicrobiales bacterium]